MDRRELLQLLGASAALAGLSPRQLAALDSGPPAHASRAFFTAEQRATVDAMADAIIPATDTPGALDAGVTDFIEIIVSEWYEDEDRERFLRDLANVDEQSEARAGTRFPNAGAEFQRAVLQALEAEGAAIMDASRDAATPFFQRFRGLVLYGYYNSEVGMRDELMFRRFPGRFDGCVDVREVTRPTPGDARG